MAATEALMEPDKATQADPLTEAALRSLKDIAVPEPVSWMPQTWGWVLVAVILAVSMAGLIIHLARRYRSNAYRREALALLVGMEGKLVDPSQREQALRDLAAILKRTALASGRREDVAALSGAAWVTFLQDGIDGEAGHALNALLDDAEYQSGGTVEALSTDDILSAARTWIRRHHVPA
jgi:hypothetical protein